MTRRLLIVSVGFGAGHNAVASSIADAARQRFPDADVQTLDVLDAAVPPLGPLFLHGNAFLVSKLPWLYGFAYHATNRQGPRLSLGERLQPFLRWPLLGPTLARVRRFQPDLVLHTHWMAVSSVARMRRADGQRFRQAVVVTDVLAHRVWFSPGVDRYFVAAAESAASLVASGVPPESIQAGGVPVRDVWTQPICEHKVRTDWLLPDERPIVVVSGGAQATCAPVGQIVRKLGESCPDASLVVLCGRNARLRGKIERMSRAGLSVLAVPFSARAHELVRAAAVYVTKSGGSTTFECLAGGVPAVLVPAVPGQETENAEWLAKHGAAVPARNVDDIAAHVRRLLDDGQSRLDMRQSALALHRPGGEAVMQYLDGIWLPS